MAAYESFREGSGRFVPGSALLEKLHEGTKWAEGPVYFGDLDLLLWSDIPNDLAVKSDGSIWFTDPTYGIVTDYEGNRADGEIGGCHVYRRAASMTLKHRPAGDLSV